MHIAYDFAFMKEIDCPIRRPDALKHMDAQHQIWIIVWDVTVLVLSHCYLAVMG